MGTRLKLRVTGLLVVGLVAVASGEDVYVGQTAQGDGSGRDASNTTSLAWLNLNANWVSPKLLGKIGPGDTVHLCGILTSPLTVGGSGLPGAPITLLFEPNAKFSAPFWTSNGVIIANSKSNIVLDGGVNGLIEATGSGTALTYQPVASLAVTMQYMDSMIIRSLAISNMYVRTPGSSDSTDTGYGFALSGNNSVIHNCTFSDGGKAIVWVLPGGVASSNIVIRSNLLVRTSAGIVVGTGGTGATATNVDVGYNMIDGINVWDGVWTNGQWFHGDGMHCWAVHTSSTLTGLWIHNNTIGPNMGTHTSGLIFSEGYIGTMTEEANTLSTVSPYYAALGAIALKGPSNGTWTVTNNVITSYGSGSGVYIDRGTNVFILKNVFVAVGDPINLSAGTIQNSDFNRFVGPYLGFFHYVGNYTLAQWQTNWGWDLHSVAVPRPPAKLRVRGP